MRTEYDDKLITRKRLFAHRLSHLDLATAPTAPARVERQERLLFFVDTAGSHPLAVSNVQRGRSGGAACRAAGARGGKGEAGKRGERSPARRRRAALAIVALGRDSVILSGRAIANERG
jgi:hypothetical protein